MQKNNENNLKEVLFNSCKDIFNSTNNESIIGKPIYSKEGILIIPVSKMTIGYLNGGGEYGEVRILSKNKNMPNVIGGGGIVNMSPEGFLIVYKGEVSFIKIPENQLDKVFDKTVDFIKKSIIHNEKI